MTYTPNPLDTSSVTFSPDVEQAIEQVARHNHDIWAKGRIEEGWSYGPKRNDDDKTHPGLVPYEDLSESEKDYDRRSVVESLKAILALGYRLEPPVP